MAPLKELRQAVGLTRRELAADPGIGPDAVLRIERQSDMLLSTLRRYVETMGGKLELVAKFPDRPRVAIGQLTTIRKDSSSRTHAQSRHVAASDREDGSGTLSLKTKAMSLKLVEWEHIQRVLRDHNDNISATARALSLPRRTLQRKLQKRPAKSLSTIQSTVMSQYPDRVYAGLYRQQARRDVADGVALGDLLLIMATARQTVCRATTLEISAPCARGTTSPLRRAGSVMKPPRRRWG